MLASLFFGALGRLTGAFRLALRYPVHAALIVAVAASCWLWRGKERAEDARDRARAEVAAMIDAQRVAERVEAERNRRKVAAQERVNADVKADYARRLADLRARYERLRAQAGRSPGSVAVPAFPDAASGTDEAPGSDGLSRAMMASEQALQLDALITWIEQQRAVER